MGRDVRECAKRLQEQNGQQNGKHPLAEGVSGRACLLG